jgi:hypothetical protein
MPKPLQRVWSAIPFKFLIGMTLVLAVVKEWYPFSHFPMYSSFEDYTYYVFVTDEHDRPVAVESLYGIRTSVLKKVYQRELRKLAKNHPSGTKGLPYEQRFPAGVDTLNFLRDNAAHPPKVEHLAHLKLYQVEIRGKNSRITQETHLVGTL